MKSIKSKKAAIEMSISTIVVIVLSMTLLILGLVFVRNIMCAGISLTDEIDQNVQNEILNLFGSNTEGVKCMGESGENVKIGTGGQRQIFCVINTGEAAEYEFRVTNIESIDGVSTETVKSWVRGEDGWKGNVRPGDPKTVTILILDIPRQADNSFIKIEVEETNSLSSSSETHNLFIDIEQVGAVNAAVC